MPPTNSQRRLSSCRREPRKPNAESSSGASGPAPLLGAVVTARCRCSAAQGPARGTRLVTPALSPHPSRAHAGNRSPPVTGFKGGLRFPAARASLPSCPPDGTGRALRNGAPGEWAARPPAYLGRESFCLRAESTPMPYRTTPREQAMPSSFSTVSHQPQPDFDAFSESK